MREVRLNLKVCAGEIQSVSHVKMKDRLLLGSNSDSRFHPSHLCAAGEGHKAEAEPGQLGMSVVKPGISSRPLSPVTTSIGGVEQEIVSLTI